MGPETLQTIINRGQIQEPQVVLGKTENDHEFIKPRQRRLYNVIVAGISTSELDTLQQAKLPFSHVVKRYIATKHGILTLGNDAYDSDGKRWVWLRTTVTKDNNGSTDGGLFIDAFDYNMETPVRLPYSQGIESFFPESPTGIRFCPDHEWKSGGPTFRIHRKYTLMNQPVRTERFGLLYDPSQQVMAIAAELRVLNVPEDISHRVVPLVELFRDPSFSGFNTYYRYADDTIYRLPRPEIYHGYYKNPPQAA